MSPAKVTTLAIIALQHLFPGFREGLITVTDLNDFNGPAQTTNLGVRSSNLFGGRHFATIQKLRTRFTVTATRQRGIRPIAFLKDAEDINVIKSLPS